MKTYDARADAKRNGVHLTPVELRKFIAEKVGDVGTVLDPAVGSGQLLQFIKAKKFIGVDICTKSIDLFKENFPNCEYYVKNYFELSGLDYDVAVTNYPFSLPANKVFVKNNTIKGIFSPQIKAKQLSIYDSFQNGNSRDERLTGNADWLFIIKSFLDSRHKKGYYFCYPGIAYRTIEQKYRSFILENNYLVGYGLLKNCGFKSTSIDLMYLELGLNPKNEVETFIYDFKVNEYLNKEIIHYEMLKEQFVMPIIDKPIPIIDIEKVEDDIQVAQKKRRGLEDVLDDFIIKTFKQNL